MIEDLIDVIDRSWASLQKRSGVDFALACFPFVEQLKRDSRTALHLEDLRSENRQSRERLATSLEAARRDLLAVFEELQETRPEVIPKTPAPQGYDHTAEAIRRPLQEPLPDSDLDALVFAEQVAVDIGFDATLLILKELLEEAGLEDLRWVRLFWNVVHREQTRRVGSARAASSGASQDLGRLVQDARSDRVFADRQSSRDCDVRVLSYTLTNV